MSELRLKHSTAYFRILDGQPEMILEHGCDNGGCFVVGEIELRKILKEIERVLALALPDHEGGGI